MNPASGSGGIRRSGTARSVEQAGTGGEWARRRSTCRFRPASGGARGDKKHDALNGKPLPIRSRRSAFYDQEDRAYRPDVKMAPMRRAPGYWNAAASTHLPRRGTTSGVRGVRRSPRYDTVPDRLPEPRERNEVGQRTQEKSATVASYINSETTGLSAVRAARTGNGTMQGASGSTVLERRPPFEKWPCNRLVGNPLSSEEQIAELPYCSTTRAYAPGSPTPCWRMESHRPVLVPAPSLARREIQRSSTQSPPAEDADHQARHPYVVVEEEGPGSRRAQASRRGGRFAKPQSSGPPVLGAACRPQARGCRTR